MEYSTDHPLRTLNFLPSNDMPHFGYLFESELFVAGAVIAAATLIIGFFRGRHLAHKAATSTERKRHRTTVTTISLLALTISFATDFGLRYATALDDISNSYRSALTATSDLSGATYRPSADIGINALALSHALLYNDSIIPGILHIDEKEYNGGIQIVDGTRVTLYGEMDGNFTEIGK